MSAEVQAHPPAAAIIARLAAATPGGVFTTAQARKAGVSAATLSRLAVQGRIRRIRRGLYRAGDGPLGGRDLIRAAAAAMGERAVVSHASALFLHGLPLPAPDFVEMTAGRAGRGLRPPPWVRLHTTGRPLGEDLVVVDGVRATSVARALVDLASDRSRAAMAGWLAGEAAAAGLVDWNRLLRLSQQRGERVLRCIAGGVLRR